MYFIDLLNLTYLFRKALNYHKISYLERVKELGIGD